ncbi:AIR synthase related protein [Thioalkalivibrio sp. HK1]|uniref:AIR synthase related protein n=1 Tax=Thioalkalivibrio sp. HK1 TaxID=1469245 RepID=UPI00046FEA98|nr:AIR synthase related protein [Thioalkalivibrio sp. HK1]
MDEFEIIDRFFQGSTSPRSDTLLGIGDDAAILATGGRPLISAMATLNPMVATKGDSSIDSGQDEGADEARAVFAQALIRLCLRRITPRWVTLALSLESVAGDRSIAWLESFACGVKEICRSCEVELVGGDTTRGANRIVVFAHGLSRSSLSPRQARASTSRQGRKAQEMPPGFSASMRASEGEDRSKVSSDSLRLGFTRFSSAAVSDLIALYRSPVAERIGPSIFGVSDEPRASSGGESLVASIDIRCDDEGKEALRLYAARHIEVVELP